MKTKLMKRMFVVLMSIALTVSPITANAATKNSHNKDYIISTSSVECSIEAESTSNKKKGLSYTHVINDGITNNSKKAITYHVKLDSSYGSSGGATATVTGYCTDNQSGNKVAANFKTTFYFTIVGGSDMTIKDKVATSSATKDAVVSGGAGGETFGTVNKINTSTVCSKTSYETKTITRSSSRR